MLSDCMPSIKKTSTQRAPHRNGSRMDQTGHQHLHSQRKQVYIMPCLPGWYKPWPNHKTAYQLSAPPTRLRVAMPRPPERAAVSTSHHGYWIHAECHDFTSLYGTPANLSSATLVTSDAYAWTPWSARACQNPCGHSTASSSHQAPTPGLRRSLHSTCTQH